MFNITKNKHKECTGSWGTQILNRTIKYCEKFKLREVPVGEQARKIWALDERFFSDFVGGKNSIPLSASNDLRLSEPKTLIKKTYKNI